MPGNPHAPHIPIQVSVYVLLAVALTLAGCELLGQIKGAQVSIDPTIPRTRTDIAGLDHGPRRPVAAMIGPEGPTLEFVSNEIVLHPANDQELQDFIARYHATVLRDGMPFIPPDVTPRETPTSSGWYLLRIDPSTSAMDGLADGLTKAGKRGVYRFSSEDAARTLAVVARERGSSIAINPLANLDASLEHPKDAAATTFVDAAMFPWFTEDSDPATPGDQGLSTGVTHAWDYLSYHGILEVPGTYYVPKIAIIDIGFDLDEATGIPVDGNLDYGTLGAPMQWDVADHDLRAGGPGEVPLAWHGQESFGIAAARPRNVFGSAGVGGHFVRPVLIKLAPDYYSVADGIRSAVIGGADVISASVSTGCLVYQAICGIGLGEPLNDMMRLNVDFARSFMTTVVAAAGNEGEEVDELSMSVHPCQTVGTICVGGVHADLMNAGNFGDDVDIWAPFDTLTTPTRNSIAIDADNIGQDELQVFSGTSAATPFVAGAVGLMKAAKQNPNLSYEQVIDALQATVNPSPDPRVPRGIIDVYRAVRGMIANQPPTVQITRPLQGATLGWAAVPLLQSNYADPEVRPDDIYRWSGEVVYSSDRDGELCRSTVPPYTCTSTRSEMTVGAHVITATATDAFDEVGTSQVSINVVNRPPEPQIEQPQAASTLYSHIPTTLIAFVPDPDETIPDANMNWVSSRDGALGTGGTLTRLLSAGAHTLTLAVVDGKGLGAQAHVNVNVISGAGLPVPQVTSPASGTLVGPGTPITLQGIATDPEDGTLAGAQLSWSSNIDGLLGTGNSITRTLSGPPVPCNPELIGHQITLTATDSDQHAVSVQTVVRVGTFC